MVLRWIFNPLVHRIYHDEFEKLKENDNEIGHLRSRNKYQKKRIDNFSNTLNEFRQKEVILAKLLESFKYNHLKQTPKGEYVIISSNTLNLMSAQIFLSCLDIKSKEKCCWIGTDVRENEYVISLLLQAGIRDIDKIFATVICDIQCPMKNRTYGTTLLSYIIEIAREQGLKYITGWLSNVDKRRHKDLQRFYERSGFEVYLFPEMEEGVVIKYLDDEKKTTNYKQFINLRLV